MFLHLLLFNFSLASLNVRLDVILEEALLISTSKVISADEEKWKSSFQGIYSCADRNVREGRLGFSL